MRAPYTLLLLAALAAAVACGSSGGGDTPPTNTGNDAGPDGAPPPGEAGADSSSPGAGLGWKSGTRLRAVVDTAGSARLFVRWHDTQLGVDCKYGVAADGKMRCLPNFDGIDIFVAYDDDQCTSVVAALGKTVPTPKFLPPPNGPFVCGTGGDYYQPGAAYVPAAIFNFDGTKCSAGAAVDAQHTYVHGTGRVASSTFALAAEVSEPRGPRLSARQYAADDGSRQDVGLLDSQRGGARCEASDNAGSAFYCIPTDVAYLENFFSDDMCKTLIGFLPGYAQQVCNRKPTAILDASGKATTFTLFEVGPIVTGPIYEGSPSACQAASVSPSLGATFYAAAAPLPVSSLAPLVVANEGSGRVLLRVAHTASGALAATVGFLDTLKSTPCSKLRAADGMPRCLPAASQSLNAFVDSACAQAVVERAGGTPAPAVGAYYQSFFPAPTGQDASAMFQVGGKIAAPAMLWQWNGRTCQLRGLLPGDDFYATTPVAPSDFVPVTTAPE